MPSSPHSESSTAARRFARLVGGGLLLIASLAIPGGLTAQTQAQAFLPPTLEATAGSSALRPPETDRIVATVALPHPHLQASRPPLNAGRVGGQILAGTVAGVGTGLLMAALADDGDDDMMIGASSAFAGFLVGFPVGVTGGAYLVGRIGDQTGSFPMTLLGTIGGVVAAVALADATEGWSFLAMPPVGATIGFNLTRRYKDRASEPRAGPSGER